VTAASWAHFACHAHSNPSSPSDSHLLLYDGSVTEISRLRPSDAELAYLSSCSTAQGSDRLADEAIHIASAFQLAGYRHVVGALWPVQDTTSAELAEDFYGRIAEGASPAHALHAAIRELRDTQPLAASLWAGYLHAWP
jgi:CHAT domain-containing protein